MLLISQIRNNPKEIKELLSIKGFKDTNLIDKVCEIDNDRRKCKNQLDELLAKLNKTSDEIGLLYKSGKKEEATKQKEIALILKENSKQFENQLSNLENKQNELLLQIPNLPHKDVKPGVSSEDNEVTYNWGDIKSLESKSIAHWDICDKLKLIDFELGSKIAGSGFPVYRGKMAKLQRSLIQYFLDNGVKNDYFEIQPPYLVNEDSGYGTGQLPDKDGQMYHMPLDNLYLIPTAEVPVTNIYRNVILKEEDLPVKLVAYSACFRREAGSYGKDVRGLNRLHQFDKVEIVRIEKPELGYKVLDEMCNYVGSLIQSLGLPYRILRLCGGDLSFTSAMTYDFEVWAGGQQRWLEVSSVSNFETFQSNRMKLRVKGNDGKTYLPHTLNGSALAIPRIVAAIIENNFTGSEIIIPKPLVEYTGFEIIS